LIFFCFAYSFCLLGTSPVAKIWGGTGSVGAHIHRLSVFCFRLAGFCSWDAHSCLKCVFLWATTRCTRRRVDSFFPLFFFFLDRCQVSRPARFLGFPRAEANPCQQGAVFWFCSDRSGRAYGCGSSRCLVCMCLDITVSGSPGRRCGTAVVSGWEFCMRECEYASVHSPFFYLFVLRPLQSIASSFSSP